jgi:hypothetical protein
MTERRYKHAEDDAPLYRVAPELGGRVWPAYRVIGEDAVVLDIDGTLYDFKADHVTRLPRPEGLPEWVFDLLIKLGQYEDQHGHPSDDWTCFAASIEAIPLGVRAFVAARGGAK